MGFAIASSHAMLCCAMPCPWPPHPSFHKCKPGASLCSTHTLPCPNHTTPEASLPYNPSSPPCRMRNKVTTAQTGPMQVHLTVSQVSLPVCQSFGDSLTLGKLNNTTRLDTLMKGPPRNLSSWCYYLCIHCDPPPFQGIQPTVSVQLMSLHDIARPIPNPPAPSHRGTSPNPTKAQPSSLLSPAVRGLSALLRLPTPSNSW